SITYAAQAGVMDLLAGRAAMLATRRAGRIWLEPDQAAGVRQCRAGRELKAFPGKARERSIEHGGGVLVLLLGRTNNLTWISRRHLIPFPLIRDEPYLVLLRGMPEPFALQRRPTTQSQGRTVPPIDRAAPAGSCRYP